MTHIFRTLDLQHIADLIRSAERAMRMGFGDRKFGKHLHDARVSP